MSGNPTCFDMAVQAVRDRLDDLVAACDELTRDETSIVDVFVIVNDMGLLAGKLVAEAEACQVLTKQAARARLVDKSDRSSK